MAHRVFSVSTRIDWTVARVSGSRAVNLEPLPGVLSTSTNPLMASILDLTMSIPTPRPETSVACDLVDAPARKIRSTASSSDRRDAASSLRMPFSTKAFLIFSGTMPPPSSSTVKTMWPCSWRAESLTIPVSGLPAATRSSLDSIPWSSAFRSMWTNGSRIFSITVLSISVSPPVTWKSSDLSSVLARSRIIRGNDEKTVPIGSMRTCIKSSCKSLTTFATWAAVLPSDSTRSSALYLVAIDRPIWTSRVRSITSSPTRFIRLSSRSTSMRMVCATAAFCRVSAALFDAVVFPGACAVLAESGLYVETLTSPMS